MEVPVRKPLPINPTETVIESNATWGGDGTTTGYLDPKKIEAGKQVMPILHRGWAMAADDLSQMGSGTDPMAAIRSYTAMQSTSRKKHHSVEPAATGLYIGGAPLWQRDIGVADAGTRRRRSQLPDRRQVIAACSALGGSAAPCCRSSSCTRRCITTCCRQVH